MSRDASLISRKQAQWEQERAEEQAPWFPFGRPGCGSPNKKSDRKERSSTSSTVSPTLCETSVQEESRRHRSRSRDRDHDRDRSRSRSRHRSHKKKKHRRHRSRSSSVVHLNPLFAAGSSYNPHQEQEIMSLRNELYMSQSRAAALEADVNRVRHEYGVIKLELDRSRINAAGTEHKLRDSLARAVNIEKTNTQLRAQVNGQTVEIEKMKERLKFFEIEQVVSKDRVNELAKRNETVVKKCEELTTRSKTLQLERDEAIHNVCVVKQQLEDARNEVEGRKKDAQSIQEQLKAAQESETQLIAEKAEMERNMREKDVQITGERRKFNQEKRKDQETMAKLTEKLTGGLKEEIDGQICIIMGTLLGIQEQQDIQLEEMRKRVNAKMANSRRSEERQVRSFTPHDENQGCSVENGDRCQPTSNPLIPPGLCYVNPLLPYQTPFNMSASLPPVGYPPMYMYSLPPGTVPVPLQMLTEANREPVCPVTLLQNLQYYPVPAMTTSLYDTTKISGEPMDVLEAQPECPQSSLSSQKCAQTDSDRLTESRGNNVRRKETEETDSWREERTRQEMLLREEEERRLVEEKEEEHRKSMDRQYEAVLKAMEKAQKEAEVLKKAKLYKHVIDGSDQKRELEERLLGVDSETGEEALRQVSQWEKQKKLDWESQKQRRSSISKPNKVDVNDNHLSRKVQPRSRSSSFGGSQDDILNCTFNVPREKTREKENVETKGHSPPMGQSSDNTEGHFRRTKSLRLPTRMNSSHCSSSTITYPAPLPSNSITNPLFSPISTRTRRMRTTHDGPLAASQENVMISKAENLQSPIPKILVEEDTKSAPLNAAGELFNRMRSRSAVSTPTSSTPSSPLSSSVYAKKLAEKGCTSHGEDRLSPDIRRRDEANLSRQSSMASLKGSLCNLASPTDSPNLNKYRSMNPAYRSFNVKKSSDRQKETLERLAKLREQLRAKENFYERPMSRNSSSTSVRP